VGAGGAFCREPEGFLGRFVEVPKGLQNVVVGETSISGIDLAEGVTYYRGTPSRTWAVRPASTRRSTSSSTAACHARTSSGRLGG
jgi:citrate synthase